MRWKSESRFDVGLTALNPALAGSASANARRRCLFVGRQYDAAYTFDMTTIRALQQTSDYLPFLDSLNQPALGPRHRCRVLLKENGCERSRSESARFSVYSIVHRFMPGAAD
jgi:hypothetical protein